MADPKRSYTKRGASLVSEHKDRKMKSYLVVEVELDTISALNTWATLFLSIGSFMLSLAVGLWSGIFVDDAPSDAAQKYGPMMETVFTSLAVLFFVLAACAICNRRSAVSRIKEDSPDDS